MILSIRFNEKKLIFNNSNIYQTIAEIDRSKKPKSRFYEQILKL
ncbi:hypothetical protein LEP1GSC079_5121 [Leptospira interrogans str. FPW1039]|uniref:Uncharacterized protein n=1 Tax=Leptospira interrogans str. FPW1039 TaxID=1193040 RepID=A0A0F6IGD9_LEPIR|nr:hypothetical protein LEP1GSC079_5121 [Leptospira interrogans str. FPW1039]